MGNNGFFGVHETLALELREKYGINIFIETGTHSGFSSLWAAHNGFVVHTVEVSNDRWENLAFAFRNEPEIHFYRGDSRTILPTILEEVKEPAIIFLDAHFAQSVSGTPIMDEIKAIKNCPVKHIIMIDDARLFGVGKDWPIIQNVLDALKDTGRDKVYVYQDVIVGEYE